MFEYLVEVNKLQKEFEEWKLNAEDLIFITEQIAGPSAKNVEVSHSCADICFLLVKLWNFTGKNLLFTSSQYNMVNNGKMCQMFQVSFTLILIVYQTKLLLLAILLLVKVTGCNFFPLVSSFK
jgi:hypothetical protein